MCPKNDITGTEKALFRKAMQTVKQLKHTKAVAPLVAPTPTPAPPENFHFSEEANLPPVASETYLQFARPGISHKILRKIKAGQYNVEAILDLHGETVAEAEQSLGTFLCTCQLKGIRFVLIIHGKGRKNPQPILKNKLNHWLRQWEDVLAFCSAKLKDGHHGAVYVLLKNTKRGT